jgi:hypothetical protein
MGTPISTTPPKNTAQAALANGAVISAIPAVLLGLTVNNTKASAQFIQLHDAVSAPADTSVPVWCGTLTASTDKPIDFGIYGMNFAVGIYVCNSSTSATKTIGSADCQFFGRINVT